MQVCRFLAKNVLEGNASSIKQTIKNSKNNDGVFANNINLRAASDQSWPNFHTGTVRFKIVEKIISHITICHQAIMFTNLLDSSFGKKFRQGWVHILIRTFFLRSVIDITLAVQSYFVIGDDFLGIVGNERL